MPRLSCKKIDLYRLNDIIQHFDKDHDVTVYDNVLYNAMSLMSTHVLVHLLWRSGNAKIYVVLNAKINVVFNADVYMCKSIVPLSNCIYVH